MPEPLRPGNMVPHFTLSTPEGFEIRVSNFRGRNSLVLIFTASQWPALISDLLDREEALEDEDAVVLVITPENAKTRPAPQPRNFHYLLDPGARVSQRFGAAHEPAVYLTDQYGEIYSVHRTSEGEALPEPDEILASLRHVNAACPE